MHNLPNLVRRIRPFKPSIEDCKEKRFGYCDWCLLRLEASDIFVFSDEIYVEVGGNPRKKQKVTLPRGANSIAAAAPQPKVQFCLMFWGAITTASDCDEVIPPLCYIWETEDAQEKAINEADMELENNDRQKIAATRILRSAIPGTKEERAL